LFATFGVFVIGNAEDVESAAATGVELDVKVLVAAAANGELVVSNLVEDDVIEDGVIDDAVIEDDITEDNMMVGILLVEEEVLVDMGIADVESVVGERIIEVVGNAGVRVDATEARDVFVADLVVGVGGGFGSSSPSPLIITRRRMVTTAIKFSTQRKDDCMTRDNHQ